MKWHLAFKSIKWKLIIMYLGLVLIVMIVSGSYILFQLRNTETGKTRAQLERYSQQILEQVIEVGSPKDFQERILRTIPESINLQGNILDNIGNTIASTTALKDPFANYNDQTVISALNKTAMFSLESKSTDASGLFREWVSYAAPVIDESGEVKYVIYTRLDASSMMQSLDSTTKYIFIAAFIALFLAAVMGYVFAGTITGPILALTKGAKNLATGNLSHTLKVKSGDEIGQLTGSFNFMASELSRNMSYISTEKNRLEILLHNMSDGVIYFDKDGELILANTATVKLLGLSEMDLNLSSFLESFNLSTKIYLEMKKSVSQTGIISVEGGFINATFTPFYNLRNNLEGIVVVLQDITEQKKLDDMRKEFVANVSHELRTPLTTIKSYTETLLDGVLDDRGTALEFLEIINSESNRMAFLVRDLLQLSRFDNNQIMLSIVEIDLNSLLSMVVKQYKIHSDLKEQDLEFKPTDKDIKIYADKERINQVINNILSNAIKYSLAGASIKIFIEEDNNFYKVFVKDTGMGIPKEDLPRIFDRFYRVDKARSRAMGGTGLGLAIAKEIMISHEGDITADSIYGKGTTMIIWFSKAFRDNYQEN